MKNFDIPYQYIDLGAVQYIETGRLIQSPGGKKFLISDYDITKDGNLPLREISENDEIRMKIQKI